MLQEQSKQSNLFVLVGLALQLIGGFLVAHEEIAFVGFLFGVVGYISFIWGCCYFAKGKGYPSAVGLLGLLSLLGLIILVILPDRKW